MYSLPAPNWRATLLRSPSTPEAIATRELRPGEQLQWAGRPAPQALARRKLPVVPIAVLLLALAGLIIYVATAEAPSIPADGATIVTTMGAFLALLGIALAAAPLVAALSAHRIVYAVTDRRLLVIDDSFTHRIGSFTPDDVQAIIVTNERPDGSADIVFRQEIRHIRLRSARYGIVSKIGFFGIADADRVRNLIREMRGDVAGAPAFLSS